VPWTDHSQFSRECPQALELTEEAVESVLLTRAHRRRPPETTPKRDRVSQFMVPKVIEILLIRLEKNHLIIVLCRPVYADPAGHWHEWPWQLGGRKRTDKDAVVRLVALQSPQETSSVSIVTIGLSGPRIKVNYGPRSIVWSKWLTVARTAFAS